MSNKDLDNINKTLEKQNEIIQQMLDYMQKPEHPVVRILTLIGIGAGALGVIHFIDVIVKWFGG
ncbi:MAG: hypothetical protein LBU83_13255 [Bacteroidales bacterium]|jgi:hypothetical protein|nr:hypothetical protein [Bacteroidales bacterium]